MAVLVLREDGPHVRVGVPCGDPGAVLSGGPAVALGGAAGLARQLAVCEDDRRDVVSAVVAGEGGGEGAHEKTGGASA